MKTKLASLFLLSVALATSAVAAADNTSIAYAFPVNQVAHQGREIRLGASKLTVRQVLGAPDRKLAPDVVVYNNFHANQELANDHGCSSMIVTFADGKVVDLKFANRRAVKLIAANLKTRPTASAWHVAASK